MDPDEIFTALRDMQHSINVNHLDVCQRLTALEVSSAPIGKLSKRVEKLEGFRNYIAGGIVTAHLLAGSVYAYLKRH
jgi:hypothetical protein